MSTEVWQTMDLLRDGRDLKDLDSAHQEKAVASITTLFPKVDSGAIIKHFDYHTFKELLVDSRSPGSIDWLDRLLKFSDASNILLIESMPTRFWAYLAQKPFAHITYINQSTRAVELFQALFSDADTFLGDRADSIEGDFDLVFVAPPRESPFRCMSRELSKHLTYRRHPLWWREVSTT